jgi:hypothetical protein
MPERERERESLRERESERERERERRREHLINSHVARLAEASRRSIPLEVWVSHIAATTRLVTRAPKKQFFSSLPERESATSATVKG